MLRSPLICGPDLVVHFYLKRYNNCFSKSLNVWLLQSRFSKCLDRFFSIGDAGAP